MEPKVGLKFRHKLLAGNPLCSVISVWEQMKHVAYMEDETKIPHVVYAGEFPHIVMEEDNAERETAERSDVPPPRKSGAPGGRPASQRARGKAKPAAPGLPADN